MNTISSEEDSLDYQLNIHVYFQEGCEEPSFFRTAWLALGDLAKIPASGYICRSDGTPHANENAPQFARLGSVAELNRIFDDDQCEIYGGLSAKLNNSSNHDADISLTLDATNAANICFSKFAMDTFGAESCLDVAKSILEIADSKHAIYGFIDYSRRTETANGSIFSSVVNLQMPFQQWILRERWNYHAKTACKARSVYWGNYLSNAMLAQLDEDFLVRYKEFCVDVGGWPNAHVWSFQNGAFISISLDPMWDRDDFNMLNMQVVNNANWIVREFCDCGLL